MSRRKLRWPLTRRASSCSKGTSAATRCTRAAHALHTRCTRATHALHTRCTRAAHALHTSSATQSVRRSLSSKGKREGGGHDSRASAPCGAHGSERGQIRGRADAPRRAQVPRQSICARRRGHRCPFPSPCTSPARRPLAPYIPTPPPNADAHPRTEAGARAHPPATCTRAHAPARAHPPATCTRAHAPARAHPPATCTRARRQAGRLRTAQVYVHDDAYVLSERTQATPCPSAARYAAPRQHNPAAGALPRRGGACGCTNGAGSSAHKVMLRRPPAVTATTRAPMLHCCS
jgi:hypothetical protein